MRVAVIGSKNLSVHNLQDYLPKGTDLIICGDGTGIAASAREYALSHGIDLMEIPLDYDACGLPNLSKRNLAMIENANFVLTFWDGYSRGIALAIQQCRDRNIPHRSYMQPDSEIPGRPFLEIWINPLKIHASIDETYWK